MTSPEIAPGPARNNQQYLEFAIPVLSFGSTAAGILAWRAGYEISFQFFALGCVVASCLLAYLAWIRPRKDIVALSTPLYAFIFFVVPTDFASGATLQLLYALSLTLLLVRLKYRFGTVYTDVSSGKELAVPLQDYASRTSSAVTAVSLATGHRAALAISRFTMGDYGEAARIAGQPDADLPAFLSRAFAIAREHALILEGCLPKPGQFLTFPPEDAGVLAIPPLPEESEERRFDTALDNALLVLFTTAWNTAEADRPHLLACREFLVKLLGE
jgi:hypothetical protein